MTNPDELQSDDEIRVRQRADWNEAGGRSLCSVTQRCRARLAWAKSGDLDEDAWRWVCSDKDCQELFCSLYYNVKAEEKSLREAEETLREAEETLPEEEETLREEEETLQNCRQVLENMNQSRQEAQSQLQSLQHDSTTEALKEIELLKERVQDKEIIVKRTKQILVLTKDNLVSAKRHLVSAKRHLVSAKNVLVSTCETVTKAHEAMKEILINGKEAGNKTDYQTLYTDKERLEREMQEVDDTRVDEKQHSPSKLYESLHREKLEYQVDLPPVSAEVKEDLKKFYLFCNNIFGGSVKSPCEYNSADFSNHIRSTCERIVSWDKKTTMKASQSDTIYRPSAIAQETRAVHPILLAIIWKINEILAGNSHATSEQFLPKQLQKSQRWIDVMLTDNIQQLLCKADGNLLGRSLEIKPITRKDKEKTKNHNELVNEGGNQTLGHALQALWDSCFQFCGGVGIDGTASGMVLTMISATLFKVDLVGVGKKDLKLEVCGSKVLPLFSKTTTEVLVTEAETIVDDLYLNFEGSNQMEKGFVALIQCVYNTRDSPLVPATFAMDATKERGINVVVDKYLGSGAFCSVYTASARKSNDEKRGYTRCVMKVGKSEGLSKPVLQNELEALKALSHQSIPELYCEEVVQLEFRIRCELGTAYCLLLRMDKGRSLRDLCKEDSGQSFIQEVFSTIKDVLDFAHSEGWYHLDVQPSNIILVQDASKNNRRFILNDWGTAAKRGRKLDTFRGTPAFSHPSLLRVPAVNGENKEVVPSWTPQKPTADFDNFSLAMTICYIIAGRVPWDGFHRTLVSRHMLEKRYQKTKEYFGKTANLDDPTIRLLQEWASADEKAIQLNENANATPSPTHNTGRAGAGKRKRTSNHN